MKGRPRTARRDRVARSVDSGLTVIEAVIVMAVIAVVAGVAAPVTANVIDASRARQAASFMAARFRLARQLAVNTTTNAGIVFDQVNGEWSFRVCRDDKGDGLRRSDLATGEDTCTEGPYWMNELFPGVAIAVDPTLTGPSGEPPNPDPVRFGKPDIASFSPAGTSTSGSLYLRSRGQVQYAVRVFGVTGRTRILRYDSGAGVWKTP